MVDVSHRNLTTNTESISHSPQATLPLSELGQQVWDVVVVGAGPAGSIAAREIAKLHGRVLLVEKANFPRWKVCGCCLNGSALAALERSGLGNLTSELNATNIDRWKLCAPWGKALCQLPLGVSLSREAFDASLAQSAIHAGAEFLDGVTATLENCDEALGYRSLKLAREDEERTIQAKIVVAADGLAGRLLDHEPGFEVDIAENSRLGAGVTLDCDSEEYEEGVIYMACGKSGYVGLVRLEDGRLDIAAAFDRNAMRAQSGPGSLAEEILSGVQLDVPYDLSVANWRGTPPLTRHRREVAGRRIFAIGDTAQYIEPFTGEGMAWALHSGLAVAPLAMAALDGWKTEFADQWTAARKGLLSRRQRTCRMVGKLLKKPRLAGATVFALRHAPWLASPMIRAVNSPPTLK